MQETESSATVANCIHTGGALGKSLPEEVAAVKRAESVSYWQRELIIGLLPLLAGACLLAAVVFVPHALKGNADFRQFYAGGYMIRSGMRRNLYEPAAQRDVENRVVSPEARVLPVNHPAYEYLFFAPLSLLSYKQAYAVWAAINVVVLTFCGLMLQRRLNDPWLVLALAGGFAPVWATLIHGQDSIWLLFFALLALESENDFICGTFLGLMSFRFHLLVPILVLYAIWKKWRVIEAAALVGAALAALCISLVGIGGSILYAKSAAATTEVRQGYPVNIYGCMRAALGSRHSLAAGLIACACAVVAFWYASRQKPSIETAILVIPLASYYLMMHDLVMLLIPIALMLRRSFASVLQFVVTVLGFSPLSLLSGLPAALMLFWPNRDSSASRAHLIRLARITGA